MNSKTSDLMMFQTAHASYSKQKGTSLEIPGRGSVCGLGGSSPLRAGGT